MAAERQRLWAAVKATELRLRAVDAATRPDREALASAVRRVEQARRDLVAAQDRVATGRRRDRRHARREVEVSDARFDRAVEHIEHTRRRATPSIVSYDRARDGHELADTSLHRHDMTARLEARRDAVGVAQRRVDALGTWQFWASGKPVTAERLSATFTTLTAGRGSSQTHDHTLAHELNNWAQSHGLELPPLRTVQRIPSRAGPEIGR
jgi:hypothetical protein